MKTFLFLFSDTGGGHRASAQAVRDEMKRLYGDSARVILSDIFVEAFRWPFNQFPRWYPAMVGFNGVPWGIGFHLSNRRRSVKTIHHLIYPYIHKKLENFIRNNPTDAVVSFHGVPNFSVSKALKATKSTAATAMVVVDLVTAHAFWYDSQFQICLVPTAEAKKLAIDRFKMPEEKITSVGGMPVRRDFIESASIDKLDAKKSLDIPADKPMILYLGGGDGMGPLERVVNETLKLKPNAVIAVITGRNKQLFDRLSEHKSDNFRVEGFVNNVATWMRASDILVTKAGPNSITEGLITELPMVLYSALPGQEVGNIKYVVDNNAGIWAPNPKQAAKHINELVNDTSKRTTMAENAKKLACPSATETITRSLWELV